MDAQTVHETLAKPIAQELLCSDIPARLSDIGLDGDPRVVPTAFWWTGSAVVVATVVTSAKVAAIRANPRVAIAVDRPGTPPRSLLVRGSATVEIVEGVVLHDFETTLPKAMAHLIAAHADPRP